MCTIATAKVPLGFAASLVEERNYNCYNVYFNECLPFLFIVTFLYFSLYASSFFLPHCGQKRYEQSCQRAFSIFIR